MSGNERKTEKNDGKSCFIITPIGEVDSDTYRKTTGVIESVIRPVLQKYGFSDIKAAHEITTLGSITTQIIERIYSDDLVIANLTGNNPNVMYELCLRHVTMKPVIHICEKNTILPFDIKDSRTIFYQDDMCGVKELRKDLEPILKELDYNYEYKDNPVYKGISVGNILRGIEDTDGKEELILLKTILEKLNSQDQYSPFVAKEVNVLSPTYEYVFEENVVDDETVKRLTEYGDIHSVGGKFILRVSSADNQKDVDKYVRDKGLEYKVSLSF